jgi:hypothetical protein
MKKFIAIACSVLAIFVLSCCSSSGGGDSDPGNTDPETPPSMTMIRKLLAGDAQANDNFGYSVAISGDYAIVGAVFEDGGAGNPLSSAGAVYIFHRTGGDTWDNGVKLVAPDARLNDEFGYSVAISGDYAIVGARGEDGGAGNPLLSAGAAYIFHRTGDNTWDGGVKLMAPDAQAHDEFGWSVAISGDYAIVGAYGEDGGAGNPLISAGAAYIFHRTGDNTWDGGVKLMAPDAQSDDEFGYSVAISGDYAIVGARFEDGGAGNPRPESGAAYIFHRTGDNTWDGGVKLMAPDAQYGDMFGCSVAISGDYAIVGAKSEDRGTGDPIDYAGAAYIFHRTGDNTWDAGTKLVAPDAQAGDYFGFSVAISGDYAIVGAYCEDGGTGDPIDYAGAAYIFHRTGDNTWDNGVKLVAPDAQAEDRFGISVAISGEYVIVGANSEDGGEGDPRTDSGAVYIFH